MKAVQIRLVGPAASLQIAIAKLEYALGDEVQISPPRKGKKPGDEYIAYGVFVVQPPQHSRATADGVDGDEGGDEEERR